MKQRSIIGVISIFFKPSIYLRSFKEVNVSRLKRQGIKLFISDLDNTLVPHYTRFPNKEVLNFIKKVKDAGIEFVIMSNNVKRRVETFAKKAGVKEWYSNARKPFKFVAKKIIQKQNLKPSEVIIMGDQIIMDILVANRLQTESILVHPLISSAYEMNRINLFIEKWLYKKFERNNILKQKDFAKSYIMDKNQIL